MSLLLGSTNETIRKRWRSILQQHYRLIEAGSLEEIKNAVATEGIALILLHRSMISLDTIAEFAATPTMVLADVPDDREAVLLFRRGVLGYANSYITGARLQEAVHAALSGQVWIGRALMQKIIRGATSTVFTAGHPLPPINGLSDREWQIALLVSKGLANLEIAAELDISERTVKAHIGAIFKKTGTGSRLQLALHVRDHLAGTVGS